MIWKSALHYARFWLVLALVSGQLTAKQKEQILDIHNLCRSKVNPEAADMLHMVWNETLGDVAQGYAAHCILDHNPDVINKLGENLYITTGPLIISKSMNIWFDENKYYDYFTDTCQTMCGHYTQMVWAKTSAVGCASQFCETVQNIHYENATILVCNYFPGGNVLGEQPYEAGEPCSKCPQHFECIENTCDQMKSTTEESSTPTWPTDKRQTKSVNSATFTTLSVPLAGLVVSFGF